MILSKRFMLSLVVLIAVLTTNVFAGFTIGVYFAGGREIERTGKPGDTVWVEQSMVHTLIPDVITHDPIIMVPGMGLSSYIFLGTPDGRKGWAQMFAEAGYPVYIYDIPEYAISGGFDVNKCNDMVDAIVIDVNDPNNPVATLNYPVSEYEIITTGKGKGQKTTIVSPETPPTYGYWSTNSTNRNIWKTWGFGYDTNDPYVDARFPVDYMDQFEKHLQLRYQDLTSQDVAPQTGDVEAEAIIPLCEHIGKPAILMIHSASAAYFEPLLLARPELFKSLINIEQAFIISDDEQDTIDAFVSLLDGKPFLSVYADYVDERGQTNRKVLSQAITDAILLDGGIAGFIDLPAQAIFGNSHLMMQDNNNDVIAGQIMDWLDINVIPDLVTDPNS